MSVEYNFLCTIPVVPDAVCNYSGGVVELSCTAGVTGGGPAAA